MDIVFLGARLPLTKTIAFSDGQYVVAPYPHVIKLTSYHEQASTLEQFQGLLMRHAADAHCLFNGQLQKPLVQQSRAGLTRKGAPREWVVFDFDKVNVDDPLTLLPKECQNVSYIVQRSSSMYVPGASSFSGHVFMLLEQASTEDELLRWYESINFTIPALANNITLTDSGLALHWPLDRTAAYDSKLIYIAPPRCSGFEPAIAKKDQFQLVRKRQSKLKLPKFTALTKEQINTRINDLRDATGLPKREFNTRRFEDGEVLLNAQHSTIHDVKAIGDHYIKFNMNGGDSFAYWLDLRNPTIIKNFKGEPWMLTEEVDPDFYKSVRKAAPQATAKPPLDEGCEVLAFYATNESAQVKTGIFDPIARAIRLDNSTQSAAAAWLWGYGLTQKGHLPHIDIRFDPTSDVQYVAGLPHINKFRATDYMARAKSKETPSTLADFPPVLLKTARSMLGDPDEATLTHYINWLAAIFQTRRKTGTAWVLSGIEGTGKSKWVEHVLRPLFGDTCVRVINFALATREFNTFLEDSLFVVFEESSMRAIENNHDLMMKLKHWITDNPVEIRAMRVAPTPKPSFCNLIFHSNERDPLVISESNRRFNITNRQEKKLVYNPNEFLSISQGRELDAFADMLKRWPVNEELLRKIIVTNTSKMIHQQTTSINGLIAEAVRNGDLEFFLDRMPSKEEAQGDFHNRFNTLGLYQGLIDEILAGKKGIVTYDDLFILFRTLIPDPRFFQDSKTWRVRHFQGLGLEATTVYDVHARKNVRGIRVEWQLPAGVPKPKIQRPTSKVVNIK